MSSNKRFKVRSLPIPKVNEYLGLIIKNSLKKSWLFNDLEKIVCVWNKWINKCITRNKTSLFLLYDSLIYNLYLSIHYIIMKAKHLMLLYFCRAPHYLQHLLFFCSSSFFFSPIFVILFFLTMQNIWNAKMFIRHDLTHSLRRF